MTMKRHVTSPSRFLNSSNLRFVFGAQQNVDRRLCRSPHFEADEVRAVYRGERRVSMRTMPSSERSEGKGRSGRSRKRRDGDDPIVDAADPTLCAALRAWRRERASEQYVPLRLFHDATLADIARKRTPALRSCRARTGARVLNIRIQAIRASQRPNA